MIKAVIIDDKSRARKLLREMLENQAGSTVKVIAEADDVETGVKAIKKHKPDLVLLDIQMHEGTGFDLLQQFEEIDFEVVFVTAYDQYAVQAFEFSAFGYLLKPIQTRQLREVIARVENHIQRLKQASDKRVKILVENYGDDRNIKKLVINNMNGFDITKIEEIIRLEGDNNYTKFILTNDQRITSSKTLGSYEDLLNDHGFYRIHQSTIVNLRHVIKYHKGSSNQVEMVDGERFNLSRHRKPGFLERFG